MKAFPTPRECPDVRLDMIRGLTPGHNHYELVRRRCDPNDPLYISPPSGVAVDPRGRAAAFQEHLYHTELYWLRADIAQLIDQNLHGIELSTTLDPTSIPTPQGLVFIEGGAYWHQPPGPDDVPMSAISWLIDGDAFILNAWIRDHVWAIEGGDIWEFAEELHDVSEIRPEDRLGRIWIRRWIVSLFAFLKTPRVVTADRRPAERHAAKRSQRAGLDLNDTHVIYLRTANHATGNGTGEDRYHHRWIVSGHWRSQPYGPQSARRRPIWIMPHLKGPEGAPLLGGDKVRAVIR